MITNFKLFENNQISADDRETIVRDYVETMLFTKEIDGYDYFDFDKDELKKVKKDVDYFLKLIIQYDLFDKLKIEDIGGNLWYERGGYGSGFFDLDYISDDVKYKLGRISTYIGGVSLYYEDGDDGDLIFDYSTGLDYISSERKVQLGDIDYIETNINHFEFDELIILMYTKNEVDKNDLTIHNIIKEKLEKDFSEEYEEYIRNNNLKKYKI